MAPFITRSDDLLPLSKFRERLHDCFESRAGALFELFDAILTAGNVPSPPHLSLASVHRRGWGSLYAALSKGRIDTNELRELLAHQPMANDDQDRPPVYAVDVSSWPHCDAECSPERGYYYHPPRLSAGQPIVGGAFRTGDYWPAKRSRNGLVGGGTAVPDR